MANTTYVCLFLSEVLRTVLGRTKATFVTNLLTLFPVGIKTFLNWVDAKKFPKLGMSAPTGSA